MSARQWNDQRIESIIGVLLRVGVLLAASVVLFGGVVYLVRNGAAPVPNYKIFRSDLAQYRDLHSIFAGVAGFRGRAIVQFGLLLLIATPVARVIFSAVAFALERDFLYVSLTLCVLAVLFFSLFGLGSMY